VLIGIQDMGRFMQAKVIMYAVASVLICGALFFIYDTIYDKGYNEAVSEYEKAYQEKRAKLEKRHKHEIETAQHEAEYWRKVAVHIMQNPPEPGTKIITKIVERNAHCPTVVGIGELYTNAMQRFK